MGATGEKGAGGLVFPAELTPSVECIDRVLENTTGLPRIKSEIFLDGWQEGDPGSKFEPWPKMRSVDGQGRNGDVREERLKNFDEVPPEAGTE